jgi:hypothetical protein
MVDSKVYDLAESFLTDALNERPSPDIVQRVAQQVQQALEEACGEEVAAMAARDDELRSLRGFDPQEVAEKF